MLKFYVEKNAEGETSPAFKDILKFSSLESFLRWANYHQNYIEKIRSLDEETTYSFTDIEGNTIADDWKGN